MRTRAENIGMYFDDQLVERFSQLEQNSKNFAVAKVVDDVLAQESQAMTGALQVAELGGGAHPDRYDKLFQRLLAEPQGHIDWVDISEFMLERAKHYLAEAQLESRLTVISFIHDEILTYLEGVADESLDLMIMKYTFDHIEDIDMLLWLVKAKLKKGGRFVATLSMLEPTIRSISTNARFLYKGEEFPEDETRTLEDGESFTLRFFKESGNPAAGYLDKAEVTKYYHSEQKIKDLAEKYELDLQVGDWKNLVTDPDPEIQSLEQNILILRKN